MDPKTETLQVSPSPDSHLLMYLKEKELRLSRGKLPVHRAAQNTGKLFFFFVCKFGFGILKMHFGCVCYSSNFRLIFKSHKSI